MNAVNYVRCEEILNELEDDARSWGSVFEEFLDCFESLTKEQKLALNENTKPSVRYGFMRQYLGHFRRSYEGCSISELKAMIKNALLFITLDNFEDDYRETILLVQLFFERAESAISKAIVKEIWLKVAAKTPDQTILKLERFTKPLG